MRDGQPTGTQKWTREKANSEPLPAGCLSSDAFQKREKANEDYAIRQREKEKLLDLKKKLAEQQAHLKQLSDHMYVPDTTTTTAGNNCNPNSGYAPGPACPSGVRETCDANCILYSQ